MSQPQNSRKPQKTLRSYFSRADLRLAQKARIRSAAAFRCAADHERRPRRAGALSFAVAAG